MCRVRNSRAADDWGKVMSDSGLRAKLKALRCQVDKLSRQNEQLTAARQSAEGRSQCYEQLCESAPDGYLLTDAAGIIEQANRAASAMLLVEKKRLVGKSMVDFVVDEDRPDFGRRLSRLAATRSAPAWQARLQPPEGQAFAAAVIVSAMGDGSGRPAGLRWLIRQLSKGEHGEEADAVTGKLRDSRVETEALLGAARAVLEHREFVPAAESIFEACKNLIGAAAGYVALLSPDGLENEVVHLDSGGLACTVDPELPMPIRGLRAEAYRSGKVVYDNDFANSRWMKFMPAGHSPLANVLFAPLSIGGKAVGLLGLGNKPGGFTDDDARVASAFGEIAAVALQNSRILESLEAGEQRLRSVVETAADAIISIDESGRIVFWNRAAEAMFGYRTDEMIGKQLSAIMPDRLRQAHEHGLQRRLATGRQRVTGKTLELVGRRKGGNELPIELTVAAWQAGEEHFFTGIIRDVTERKRAEESLRVSHQFLAIANRHEEMASLLNEFMAEVERYTGCSAVGIRLLDEQGNIPYQVYTGFSRSFFASESPLSIHNDQCMCSNVIKQATDATLPFYTQGGSFYMNGTSRFLATVSEADKGRTRNVCNEHGFESVALVPIPLQERVLGLIHVADARENMVPLEKVQMLEGAALQVGAAIQRAWAEQELKKVHEQLEIRVIERTAALTEANEQLKREIAERRRIEEALRTSETRLTNAQRVASMGSWEWDLATGYLHWSDQIYRIFGLSRQEFGATYEAFFNSVHPDDRQFVQEHVDAAVHDHAEYGIDHRIVLPDGEVRYVHEQGEVAYGANGRPVRMIGTVIDITKRKRTEEALRQSQEQYRTLIQTMSEGLAVQDEHGLLTYVNDRFCELVGYSRAELIGQSPMMFMDQDNRAIFKEQMTTRAEGVYRQYEITLTTKDGQETLAFVSPRSLFDADGRYIGSIAVVTDISARVAAANQARQRQAELAHVARLGTMGEMASGLAHELNQPLSAIVNYIEACLARIRAGTEDPKVLLDDLAAAAGQAERAGEIIDHIRSFTRRSAPRRSTLDINLLVREAVDMMKSEIQHNGVQVRMELADDLPLVVGEAIQIQQVMVNLIRNGVEAMADNEFGGRQMTVRTCIDADGLVECAIADTGPGLPDDAAEQVFEQFFTTKAEGMGMGLSISRTIMEAHRGRLWATPNPERGTTFQFTLPTSEGDRPDDN